MDAEQLYFIIGFLLGVMLMGSICLAICVIMYERFRNGE